MKVEKCSNIIEVDPKLLGSFPNPPLFTVIKTRSKYPIGFFIGSGSYYYKMDRMGELSIFKHKIKREYFWFFLKQVWKYKKFDWWNK